jgi:hypothetical protein
MIDSFWSFISERQRIWYRRYVLRHDRPWTSDSVLRDNHFTNVYRELDPGTQFAHSCTAQLDRADALTFAVAYRMINRRQTVEDFGAIPTRTNVNEWLSYIADRYTRHELVCTRRHLTPHRKQYDAAVRSSVDVVLPHDPKNAMKALRSLPGVGRFIGWQIHCDLVEAGHVAYDSEFVVVGDGAGFAIAVLGGAKTFNDYIHDGKKKHESRGRVRPNDANNEQYAAWVRWLRDQQHDKDFIRWNGRMLDVKNIEHALCEWTRWGVLTQRGSIR